jgi:hypothetical protein
MRASLDPILADPLREVRELGAIVARHRDLLAVAEALTPADRALVVALARRLSASGGPTR